MAKRATPEINASSMADIAFLLLIFFLVTTTMDVDTGIQRQLPPIPENKDQKTDVEVNKRNIYLVLVNSRGNISVNQSWMDIDKLREDAKRFINCDRADDPTLPEMEEITVEGIKGPVKTSKGIISLLIQVYNGRTAEEIRQDDFSFVESIGLRENLSPTRANGLNSMIETIRREAEKNA